MHGFHQLCFKSISHVGFPNRKRLAVDIKSENATTALEVMEKIVQTDWNLTACKIRFVPVGILTYSNPKLWVLTG